MSTRRRPKRSPAAGGSSAESSVWLGAVDGGVLVSAGLLIGIGVVMSYSSTAPLDLGTPIPALFLKQLTALAIGLSAAALVVATPIRFWRALAIPAWAVGVLLLAATALFGVEVNGAQRWLEVPGLGTRFQPVEPVKCATLLAVVSLVARRDGRHELSERRALLALALTAPVVGLLLIQPDLGNAVVLLLLVGAVLVVAGAPLRRLLVGGVGLAVFVAAYVAANDYARRRVVAFLDPGADPHGSGYQLIQSFIAFSRGGLLGEGLGNARQKLYYLPEAHTDFILALIAEELGLVGVVVVLGSFGALWVAGTRLAAGARDRFALLLAFAMTALLTVPAALNAAVVMGAVPTKGLTLPFLSYGGTSIITCCIGLGLLLAAGRHSAAGGSRWR